MSEAVRASTAALTEPGTESGRRFAEALAEWIGDREPGRAVAEALTAWARARIREVELEAAELARSPRQ